MDAAANTMIDKAVDENPEVQRLKEQIAAQQVKSTEVKNISAKGEKEPLYLQLLAKIKLDETTLDNVRKEMRPKVLAEMKIAVNNQREQDLVRMQAELEEYKTMEKWLTDDHERRAADVKTFNGDTIELQFRQTELARAEEVLNLISKRVLELRTEQRAPDRIKLLQSAAVPSAPLEVFPYRNVVLMALAGLCLPFVLVLGREYLARRVSDAEQLEGQSNLKVMAEIAHFPVRTGMSRNGSSGRVERDLMVFEESIDGLRTSLMLAEHLKDVKSARGDQRDYARGQDKRRRAIGGEHRASLGREDAVDRRRHAFPRYPQDLPGPLGTRAGGRVGRRLCGRGCHRDQLERARAPAARRQAAHSPHKLLGNGELKALLEEVRSSYRYIIIDTPPVLAASESLVLAKAADATLMCTMRDSSRIDQVKRAYERLVAAGTPPIGTVLSGVPAKQYSYRYGTYAYSSD